MRVGFAFFHQTFRRRADRVDLGAIAPAQEFGDRRSRRFAQQAPAHIVADGRDLAVGELEIERHAVAAQRVVHRRATVGVRQPALAEGRACALDQSRMIQGFAHATGCPANSR